MNDANRIDIELLYTHLTIKCPVTGMSQSPTVYIIRREGTVRCTVCETCSTPSAYAECERCKASCERRVMELLRSDPAFEETLQSF